MASGSSTGGNVSPSPASILLVKEVEFAFSRNHTTARAKRLGDKSTVEVTFWAADPPDVSFYTLYCKPLMAIPDADADDLEVQSYVAPIPVPRGVDVCMRPRVLAAEGRFVLLSALFCANDEYEYFMYKDDPKSPSLESLPLPDEVYGLHAAEFAIVPRGYDGHYLLIALCRELEMKNYRLHIYSSEVATWTSKELLNPRPPILIIPDKVFVIRDRLLLWVDLLRGILVCDVLHEHHRAEFIPLPEPLLGNREQVKTLQPGVRRFRDVTFVDGWIKFIEMEHRETERKVTLDNPINPRTEDVLYDSVLIKLIDDKPVKPRTRTEVLVNGWSAMTWTRHIGSNCWRKGHIVDVDDILVDDSVLSVLRSSEKSDPAGSLTFKNLSSAWPILSTDGSDVLYLRSCSGLARASDKGVMVAVDLAEKKVLKVEALTSHYLGNSFWFSPLHIFQPCALENHLKMTPGAETLASQITLKVSSAEPNSTVTHVSETDSYVSVNKRPRLSAEKVNHARNGAQSTVPNVLISEAHSNQNNMPPQLSVNRLELEPPGFIGYSSWPHQNKQPPPLCFNEWARPSNSTYTLMPPVHNIHNHGNYQWQQPLLLELKAAPTFGPHHEPPPQYFKWARPFNPACTATFPAPNIHSYGNYQSLLQQPLLLEQMAAPRRFGLHEAPHQFFNNWNGASYHGNSQQHPAGNSYSYMVPTHQAAATTSAVTASPP